MRRKYQSVFLIFAGVGFCAPACAPPTDSGLRFDRGVPGYVEERRSDSISLLRGSAQAPGTVEPTDPPACAKTPPDLQWGGKLDDEVHGLAIDSAGALWVSGYTGGRVGIENIDPSGDSSAFLHRITPCGVDFRHELTTSGTDVAEDIVIHPATRELYLIGRSTGAVTHPPAAGSFDIFVQRLSPDGAPLNTVQYGDERPQHPVRAAFDGEDGLLIGGYNDAYVRDRLLLEYEDAFVLRWQADLTSAGTGLWHQQFDTRAPDYLASIATSPAPESFGYAADIEPSGSYVYKFDLAKQAQWRSRITTTIADPVAALLVDAQNRLFVAGSTLNQLGQARFGRHDVFVARLSQDTGQPLWITQLGTEQTDWVTAMATDASGNLYVTGQSSGSLVSGYRTTGPGDLDLFVLKLSPEGALLGVWQRGTPEEDYPARIAVGPSGDVFVAGYTAGSLVPPARHGARDAFVVRLDVASWSFATELAARGSAGSF